jgi:predicted neuraminidase
MPPKISKTISMAALWPLLLIMSADTNLAQETKVDEIRLRRAVTFYASFDEEPKGDLGGGDLNLRTRFNHETEPGKFVFTNGFDAAVFRVARDQGISGGALECVDVLPRNGRIFFPAQGNIAYRKGGWAGSASFWIKTDPNTLLKTTFCDPVQITQKGAGNGGLWVDFNNEKPRDLRHGAFPSVPEGIKPIPESDPNAPMVWVKNVGFKASDWHHVAFTWKNFDTGQKDAISTLYIDGQRIGEISGRDLHMDWELEKTGIYVAVSFIGLLDEFALFNRELTAAEVAHLHKQPAVLSTLARAKSNAQSGSTGEIQVERIFGPEIRTGPYKHPACIEQLQNGDLFLVYYGGAGEYAENTAVYGSRLKKGEKEWSAPAVIASHPFLSLGNAVIWQAPDGVVWLFYVTRFGETWSTSRIAAKISKDGAKSWSDSFMISFEEGTMVRGHPIVLANGDYLLPIYHETGHDPERVGSDTTSLFLRFDPRQKRWTESSRIRSRTGNLQPAVVQISAEHLIAYCRRGGNYEPVKDGYIIRAESRDGGRTWSEGKDSAFPNPNAAVDFLKLKNGHLLLVYNDSMNERSPLTVAISTDNGQTFPHRRNVAEGAGDFAYPTAIQTQDGKIHVTFTTDERTVVRRAIFDESAIVRGK